MDERFCHKTFLYESEPDEKPKWIKKNLKKSRLD